MRRRQAIALIGGAAAWPLAAPAQPRRPRLGVLVLGNPDPEPFRQGFRQGLRDLGYVEGETVAVEFRLAEGRSDRLPELAAELVRARSTTHSGTNRTSL